MPDNDAIPCPDETTPARTGYFSGMILSEDDLRTEQDYHLAKHRTHNRYLHGSGIVCGLEVETSQPASASVVVQPGVAIDCCGREIRVIDPIVVDPRALLDDGRKRGLVYLTLAYGEEEVEPLRGPAGDGNGDPGDEPTRIREIAQIGATRTDPAAAAGRDSRGEQPTVLLAALELSRRKRIKAKRIDNTVRPILGADPGQAAMASQVERLQRRVTELRLAVLVGVAACLLRWWMNRQRST